MDRLARSKFELAELTQKSADLFDLDMQDFVSIFKPTPVVFKEWDILMIWDDVKESIGYVEHEGSGKIGRGLEIHEWSNPEAYSSTVTLLKKHFKEASGEYPIEYTSRLLKWYSIFKPAVLDLPCYEPTERDYSHYFILRGDGAKIDKLEELVGGGILFYYFIHRLYFHQAQGKRRQLLHYLLSDPSVIEALKNNAYVVPANLQFILTTPQVYHAYANALMEGTTLPLPTTRSEAQKAMHASAKERDKLAAQILRLQQEGYTIEDIQDGQLVLTK